MSIITITSDFGYKDSYVSSVKARLLSGDPNVRIVDISHGIKPYNIKEGFFVLNNAYQKFPKNTIHLFLVNALGSQEDHALYAFKSEEQYFICTGKSLLMLFNREPEDVVQIEASSSQPPKHEEVALQILKSGALTSLGTSISIERPILSTGIITSSHSITGAILHIDTYGNAVTNITREEFEQTGEGRSFEISFGRERVNKISSTYHDVENGDALCLFNNMDQLELAMSFGNAGRLLGLNVEDKIKIEFF